MSESQSNTTKSSIAGVNSFMNGIMSLTKIFDAPATFFHEKITKTETYPYYHRNYKAVPSIDECHQGDQVCFQEANEQFLRERKVDKFITTILHNRVRECYAMEGPYDGSTRCRQLDDDLEKATTNYFIKYGDLSANTNVLEAYMKQKHRLVWQRQHPDIDIVGMNKMEEKRKEIAEYQKRITSEPLIGR